MNNKELNTAITKKQKLVALLSVFFSFLFIISYGQVTIVVNKIPDSTPILDTLYIAGSFNDWQPDDKRYILQKKEDGTFSITLPKRLTNFKYKVTRGTWKSVEGDINGKKTGDRTLTHLTDGPLRHPIQVLSWEDMALYHSWDIIVDEIPDNTPFDAQLFISGNFNNWKENDFEYRLTKLEDGTYAIKIPKELSDTICYKFHRGNWKSVESRKNGRTQFNRLSTWNHSQNTTAITCKVDAWEDIGGGSNLFFSFIIIASVFQAVVLIVSLQTINGKNSSVTTALSLLLFITAAILFSRLATYNRFVFDWQPKLLLIADIGYFLYAPAFYFLITRMAGVSFPSKFAMWIFSIPPVILFLFYLPMMVLPTQQFVFDNIDGKFTQLFNWTAVIATVYNTIVFISCIYLIVEKHKPVKNYGYQSSSSYLLTIMIHIGTVLLLWIFSHLVYVIALLFHFDGRMLHESSIDALWMVLSLSSYVHTFLVVRKPELFKLKEEKETEDKKNNFQKENLESLKNSLAAMMKKQKPYLNSKLGLQDLAERMNTNLHTLSWIINEGYTKNYFDFINEYRIEEFKRLITSEHYKKYTFLAIAMEVGFSSKTTFNRAFKKCTGKTPREYFNNVQESRLEGITE